MTDAISTTRDRILTLDIVRGIAVMGILVMNIAAFALPYPAYATPRLMAAKRCQPGQLDLQLPHLRRQMRGLFSIMFGPPR